MRRMDREGGAVSIAVLGQGRCSQEINTPKIMGQKGSSIPVG